MNTHDVSDLPECVELLQKQKRVILDARARAGERPPAGKTRAETILQFNIRRMAGRANASATPNTTHVMRSFVPSPYTPCIRPLCDLTKIMIDDLRLETHHRGTYLMLRSITPQDRMTAVMSIVEDENGDHLLLQLYHQEDGTGGAAEDILVEGMAVIVKEPYLKLTSDGGYGLRVDHLSDVIFLSADNERIPSRWQRRSAQQNYTAMAWKTRGNDYFGKSRYRAAIEW